MKNEHEKLVENNAIQTTDTNLVKKTDHGTKISETKKKIRDHNHAKYITTQKYNKMVADNFAARLAQAKLGTKDDITDFVKETDFDNEL